MQNDIKLRVNYACPECHSYLRIWNNIIFTIKSQDGKKKGILLLNPKMGNFSITSHPTLKLTTGELIDFLCPVCHSDLTATDINKNLVRILMIDSKKQQYDVYFSRVTGEQSTFQISKDNIIAKYGKDDSHYVNYFLSKFKEQ